METQLLEEKCTQITAATADISLLWPRVTHDAPRNRTTWSLLPFERPPQPTPEPLAGAEATETVQPGEGFGFLCALGKQEPLFQPWGIPHKNLDFQDFEGGGKEASSGEQTRVEDEPTGSFPCEGAAGSPASRRCPPRTAVPILGKDQRPAPRPCACRSQTGWSVFAPQLAPQLPPPTNSLLSSNAAPHLPFLSIPASWLSPLLRPVLERPRHHEADPRPVLARNHLIISLPDHPTYNPSAPPRTPYARPCSACSAAPRRSWRTRMLPGLRFPRQNIQNIRTGRARLFVRCMHRCVSNVRSP